MYHERSQAQRHLIIVFILLWLTPLVLSDLQLNSAAHSWAVPRTQPILLESAARQPDAVVSVIVQKTGRDRGVEESVIRLGGRITKDLHIINAFAAKMKAKDAVQLAKAQDVRWVSLDAVTRSATTTSLSDLLYETWASGLGAEETMGLSDGLNLVDSHLGPNGTFALGLDNKRGSVTGFQFEVTPGTAVAKVEVLLAGYVPSVLKHDFKIKVWLGGTRIKEYAVKKELWAPYFGAGNSGLVALDVTSARAWKWSDLDNALSSSRLILDRLMAKIHLPWMHSACV